MNETPLNGLTNLTTLSTDIKILENDFLTLIKQRLGIIIHPHQKIDLHHTLLGTCQKFSLTPQEYLSVLTSCPNNSLEFSYLITRITIGETYFFRDHNQMQLLKEKLLPEIIKSKRKKGDFTIRIWSAGCSTGEDIYTIAMMLCELIPDYSKWTLQLMGTDINTISLQKAMSGYYGQWSMRTISDYFKNKYFITDDHHYQLSANIRELVNFSYLNLNEPSYPSILNGTNAQDLILCCNVLIYFDNISIVNLMKRLADSLVPGGYLILGASDPVMIKETCLLQHHEFGLYFSRPSLEASLTLIEKPLLKPALAKPISIKKPLVASTDVSTTKSPDLTAITKLMQNSKWQDALNLIETYQAQGSKDIFLFDAKATALANLGKLPLALACCHEGLMLDATHKHLYFTHAMILLELNELAESEKLLRKAIFLDHRFVEAHYQLGLLLLRCKDKAAGLKCLRNTLAIAKNEAPEKMISAFNSLTFNQLVTILENELVVHSMEKTHGKQ